MRWIWMMFMVVLYGFNGFCQGNALSYQEYNLTENIASAQREHKQILLYFHFDGCGACAKMERETFRDNEVFQYYKDNFILVEVNTRKGKGVETNKYYQVLMHPTFMYMDMYGSVIHKVTGYLESSEFLREGRTAVDRSAFLSKSTEEYKKGNRESQFLYEYVNALDKAYALDSCLVHEYLHSVSKSELQEKKNLEFIYNYTVYRDQNFITYGSPYFAFLNERKDLFYLNFEKNQVDARRLIVIRSDIEKALRSRDKEKLFALLGLLKDVDTGKTYMMKDERRKLVQPIYTGNLTAYYQTQWYKLISDKTNETSAMEEFKNLMWNRAELLNHYAKSAIPANGNVTLEAGLEYSKRAVELRPSFFNLDTYAALLYKNGDVDLALATAKEAITAARQKNNNYDSSLALVRQIEREKGK